MRAEEPVTPAQPEALSSIAPVPVAPTLLRLGEGAASDPIAARLAVLSNAAAVVAPYGGIGFVAAAFGIPAFALHDGLDRLDPWSVEAAALAFGERAPRNCEIDAVSMAALVDSQLFDSQVLEEAR